MIKRCTDWRYSFFNGTWQLIRLVSNAASLTAITTFESYRKNYLWYRESGVLHINDEKRVNTSQEYYYYFGETSIDIYFNNQKQLYISLPLMKSPKHPAFPFYPAGRHYCSRDTYKSTYIIESPNLFKIDCEVSGPKKDYSMISVYERIK